MTDEEKVAALDIYHEMIKQAFAPLMADKAQPGLLAVRVFFSMRQKDGTVSGSISGVSVSIDERESLKSKLAILLLGHPDQAWERIIEQPRKS